MIKRILVALDPDKDTTVATRYAVDIAKRFDAEVTGLAVVDTGYHDAGGGVGSMYYAEKLRERTTEEGRAEARRLVEAFEARVREAGVRFGDFVQEGDPTDRIVDDMKYYDLLIIGHEPHFLYGRPGQETKTLEEVIHETVTPTLVVEDTYRSVSNVLIAFDGSASSARTLHRFAQLKPFGADLSVELVHIYDEDPVASEMILNMAKGYLEAHGFSPRPVGLSGGRPDQQILAHAAAAKADLVVVGAHSVSKLMQLAFGSTTMSLLKNSTLPLFMDS